MLTPFNVFAVVVVVMLWWIGSNVYAIAKRTSSAYDPDDGPLTSLEYQILSKRPDHADATDEEWLAWHEKYKDKIDTKYFMPERFNRP